MPSSPAATTLHARLRDAELLSDMHGFLTSCGCSEEIAREIIQDACVGILAGDRRWDGEIEFDVFAIGVVRSKLSGWRKKRRRELARSESFEDESETAVAGPPDSARDAEARLARHQRDEDGRRWIRQVFEETPRDDHLARGIIDCADRELFSIEELASELHASPDEVRLARRRMRTRVGKTPPPRGLPRRTAAVDLTPVAALSHRDDSQPETTP